MYVENTGYKLKIYKNISEIPIIFQKNSKNLLWQANIFKILNKINKKIFNKYFKYFF